MLKARSALTLDLLATLTLALVRNSISRIAITVMIMNARDVSRRIRSRRRRGCGGRSFVRTVAVAPDLQRSPLLASFWVNRILGIDHSSSEGKSQREGCQF